MGQNKMTIFFALKQTVLEKFGKKLIFQNFATLKCGGGHVNGSKYLKICMDIFLAPAYQTNSKKCKIYNSFGYFFIGPI